MPGMSVDMDQGAMAGTRGLCSRAEPGWQSEAKVATGAKPKAAEQSRDLYDIVIQHIWP